MLVIRTLNLVLLGLLLLALLMMFVTIIRSQAAKREKSKDGALPSDAGIRDLLQEGQKQAAIDLYRRFTGVDAFTAANAVDEIERELRLGDTEADKFRQVFAAEGKAAAIEAYQEATGANLADALEFVESL